jgi:hypothetical protein
LSRLGTTEVSAAGDSGSGACVVVDDVGLGLPRDCLRLWVSSRAPTHVGTRGGPAHKRRFPGGFLDEFGFAGLVDIPSSYFSHFFKFGNYLYFKTLNFENSLNYKIVQI